MWIIVLLFYEILLILLQGFPLIVTPVIVTTRLVQKSDIVTTGYCDTFRWSQQCHNKREALYQKGPPFSEPSTN